MEGKTWVAGVNRLEPPGPKSRLRDDKMRVWVMGSGRRLETADGLHQEDWHVLHRTTDLVLVG